MPMPVAVWFMVQLCGLSIAGIAVSNPAEGMDIRLLCLLYIVSPTASATGWSLFQRSPTECVI
jgi:hypothetical protein